MTSDDQTKKADRWDEEFRSALDELRESTNGIDGSQCALIIEQWELKYRRIRPHLAPTLRDVAGTMHKMLLKNPGTNVNIQGKNINFQQGKNVAHVGNVGVPADGTQQSAMPSKPYLNWASAVIAGLLAVWWCLPDTWAAGRTRALVTVFLAVVAAVSASIGWFQFRRANWEKTVYFSLAGLLIAKSFVPTVGGWLGFSGAHEDKANGLLAAYLSVTDDSTAIVVQVVAAVILCGFALLTKSR